MSPATSVKRAAGAAQVLFAGLMQYDGELKLPEHYLVDPPVIQQVSIPWPPEAPGQSGMT